MQFLHNFPLILELASRFHQLPRLFLYVLATSDNGTAIIPPGSPRLGPDPKWDRRNALKVCWQLTQLGQI